MGNMKENEDFRLLKLEIRHALKVSVLIKYQKNFEKACCFFLSLTCR